ncbi:WW domain-containing oxidoreductase [Podospora australis]|uniref:WW domain-containing oxidoreductase n=1 Tax=Podospora australis TaxID=1536484 RepID=A0AAN7AET5_9PEZI|nr:WW domain-containing oxidoreductase [Podospora australis]
MPGTIIVTGANGSIARPAVEHLLANFPDFTLVLAVRNDAADDVNTKTLRDVVAKHEDARVSIRKLDLFSLSDVHAFARTISAEIRDGKLPPLASIVCNAFYWNLAGPLELTNDGYEKSFQVIHLAHVALILRLLGSFGLDGGRIIIFSTDGHEKGKNNLEQIPPAIPTEPEKLDLLVKPAQDDPAVADALGWGFNRYANAKLASITWGHALNKKLEKDPKLSKINVVIINPGNIADSYALLRNTPQKLHYISKFLLRPFRPILKFVDPTVLTSAEAGVNIARVAVNDALPGERGYFTLLNKDESSADSHDEARQNALWARSAQWVGLSAADTVVPL